MEAVLLGVICLAIIGTAVSQYRFAREQHETLANIHSLVNSHLSEALDDIAALKAALIEERRSKKNR